MPDLALIGFVFFGLFSPGPNVILLTASGARFGVRATVPHILGVALGVGITAAVTGFGVGVVLQAAPVLTIALKIAACAWILLMANRLWHARPADVDDSDRPFTLVEAILFQWVNPKVWAVALSATAYIADEPPLVQAQILSVTFASLNLAVCTFWTFAGHLLSRLLQTPALWQVFMRIMAVALIVFSVLVFL
ncbi:LysE family translocator [Yoonia sp. R2331]|uniref:LysE family translocator n=1 Tax=Yoonia sp. R2331 TaxID=3237238 RepID=UPI0034E3ADF7